ncbi:MAG: hypothetical protein NVS3B16_01960 [Vulcanimicrobiaceae bacterium]
MLAARQRLLDVRSHRIEQLLRVRVVMRALLADFFETLDPIVNVRLAEVSAEGSKAHGVLAISLSFFEGTRMRLAVDTSGRFSHEVSIPSAFDDVARILEIDVSSDLSGAGVLYEPIGAPDVRRRLDLVAVTLALLAHAVAAVEDEANDASAGANALGTTTPATAMPAPELPVVPPAAETAPRLSVAGRIAASVPAAAPATRLTLAPVTPPNKDVLRFNVS